MCFCLFQVSGCCCCFKTVGGFDLRLQGDTEGGELRRFFALLKELLKSSLPFEFIFYLSHSTLSTFLFDIVMMVAGQTALFSVACKAAGCLCDVSHSFYSKHRAKRNNCLRLYIYSLKENFFVLHRQFFSESKSGAKKKKSVTIDHCFPKVTSRD